jgi:hypothetical protein
MSLTRAIFVQPVFGSTGSGPAHLKTKVPPEPGRPVAADTQLYGT